MTIELTKEEMCYISKIRKINNQIFTKEFEAFLGNMPKEYYNQEKVMTVANDIAEMIDGKKSVECIRALSIMLINTVIFQEKALDSTYKYFEEREAKVKTGDYIQ